MKITTKAVFDIAGNLIKWEGFEYFGPLALADRGQSSAAFQQAQGAAATDQNLAAGANTATNQALQNYSNNLNDFMKYGRQTYGANGEYMRDQNTLANKGAAAGTT